MLNRVSFCFAVWAFTGLSAAAQEKSHWENFVSEKIQPLLVQQDDDDGSFKRYSCEWVVDLCCTSERTPAGDKVAMPACRKLVQQTCGSKYARQVYVGCSA